MSQYSYSTYKSNTTASQHTQVDPPHIICNIYKQLLIDDESLFWDCHTTDSGDISRLGVWGELSNPRIFVNWTCSAALMAITVSYYCKFMYLNYNGEILYAMLISFPDTPRLFIQWCALLVFVYAACVHAAHSCVCSLAVVGPLKLAL